MTPASRRLVLALSCIALVACGTNETRTDAAEPGVVIGGGGGSFDGADAGADADAPGDDAGVDDAGGDDGGLPSLDVGPGVDTGGTTDTGGSTDAGGAVCAPGETACDGDILLTCNADGTAVGRTRCAARDAFCAETDAGAECVPFDALECEPGSEFCSDDGRALVICSDDGTGIDEIIPCANGCDFDEGECIEDDGGGACADLPEVEAGGNYAIDFCDADDDAFYEEQRDTDCQDYGYGGPDAVARFTLDAPARVLIDLRDDDGSAAIDTILYLRTDCEDQTSQIACSDDIPCDQSDVTAGSCVDGRQPRQSRLELELDAGTYYVVADTLQYTSRRSGTEFGCGRGLLRIRVE